MTDATIEKVISSDFEDVVRSLGQLSQKQRDRVLKSIERRFGDRSWRMSSLRRSVLARMAVGLLPESYTLIKQLLKKRRDLMDYEIHFSLFCYLNWTTILPSLSDRSGDLLELTRRYLLDARSDQAMAAWMAGDMLGDHWEEIDEATRVLIDVLRNARSPVGRLAALHGIEHMCSRSQFCNRLSSVLSEVGKDDKSRRVRQAIVATKANLTSLAIMV